MNAWIKLSAKSPGQVLGELLLDEDALPYREYILSVLLLTSDAAALPYLREAGLRSQSLQNARLIEEARALLDDPVHCKLISKWYAGDAGWQGWECQYRCAGPTSVFLSRSSQECFEVALSPNRVDAGR
jgi:hypothetical protein